MKCLKMVLILILSVSATGCVDLQTQVHVPESAFDGVGIDVIGTADNGGIVTKDMRNGEVYTSPQPVRVALVDAAAEAAAEAAAQEAAEREMAELAITGILGEDTRWFKSWRGLRTLPDPAAEKAAAEKAEAKKAEAAMAAAKLAEAAAKELAVVAALGEDTRWFKSWRSPRELPSGN